MSPSVRKRLATSLGLGLALILAVGMATSLFPGVAAETAEVTIIAKENGCPVGKDLCFDISEIRANVGDTIILTAINDADNTGEHDVMIGEFDVHVHLHEPGYQDTVTFTLDRAGTFTFYCSVPGHRVAGMEGALVVGGSGADIAIILGMAAGIVLAIGVVTFVVFSAKR